MEFHTPKDDSDFSFSPKLYSSLMTVSKAWNNIILDLFFINHIDRLSEFVFRPLGSDRTEKIRYLLAHSPYIEYSWYTWFFKGGHYLKEIIILNSFFLEEKDPRFTRLKQVFALRLLSKELFYIRAMYLPKTFICATMNY